jgi:hypothetical protein
METRVENICGTESSFALEGANIRIQGVIVHIMTFVTMRFVTLVTGK